MKWYFFKTLREKQSIVRKLKKGDIVPFCKYLLYRFRLSPMFHLRRKWYTMRVFYSPYAFWLWTHEGYEKDEELFFASFIKEGDTVVDCGAHIGTLTITASKLVGDKGRVFSYEAHPRTFSYLVKNVKDNNCSNVTVKHCAIGESQKEVSFSDYYASDLNAIEEGGRYMVTMTTLDSELKDIQTIDLLKLDIEGCELPAILGATEVLKRTKAVYFESAEKSFSRYGYSLHDVIKELEINNFVVYKTYNGVITDRISEAYTTQARYENLLAIKLV